MSEKWIKSSFDKCFELHGNNTLARAQLSNVAGRIQDVHYGDVLVKYFTVVDCDVAQLPSIISDAEHLAGKDYAKDGDIVFADTAEDDTVGKAIEIINVGGRKVVSGLHTIFARPKFQFAPTWLGHYVNSNGFHSQILPYVCGSKVSSISRTNIRKTCVVYPKDISAQRHIAEVLSTCDEVIEKSERAAEKYRQIKAGMLKDLLTRGIDNRGKLRPPPSAAPELYKDSELGPIPKEWEVKRLGDESVSVINPPACPLPSTFVYIDLESVKGGVLLQENLISREEAPSRAQRNVSVGDILYQLVRPYQMNNLLFRKSSALDYVASTGYALIRAAGDAGYLFQYVHTTEFVNKVLGMCTGTGYPAITPNNLSKILVRVPSLPEQRAIAARLAAVDERIAAEVKAAGKYRKVKAGLMEKLLTPPADAEIEDRTKEVAA